MRLTEFFSSEIRYLNQRVGELMLENKELKEANAILKKGSQVVFKLEKDISNLLEENKRLKELEERLEGNRFFFRAQMELSKPKTFREAEDLQKAKKIYEELYMKELRCVEEENEKLKLKIEELEKEIDRLNLLN